MNYQQQHLNNIYNQIQETELLIDRIKCNYMLSSSEDDDNDDDIKILNNFNQSIQTPHIKTKHCYQITTNASIFNETIKMPTL